MPAQLIAFSLSFLLFHIDFTYDFLFKYYQFIFITLCNAHVPHSCVIMHYTDPKRIDTYFMQYYEVSSRKHTFPAVFLWLIISSFWLVDLCIYLSTCSSQLHHNILYLHSTVYTKYNTYLVFCWLTSQSCIWLQYSPILPPLIYLYALYNVLYICIYYMIVYLNSTFYFFIVNKHLYSASPFFFLNNIILRVLFSKSRSMNKGHH